MKKLTIFTHNALKMDNIFFFLLLASIGIYIYCSFFIEINCFGFNQFKRLKSFHWALFFLVGIFLIGILRSPIVLNSSFKIFYSKTADRLPKWVQFSIIALCSFFLFLFLRNQWLNLDGAEFELKFFRDIPVRGAHVTYDELLELYVHSRFWYYMNMLFSWKVKLSYQVLSSLAGGGFIFFLLLFSEKIAGRRFYTFFFGVISGEFMQLYFGDVENYTITNLLVFLFFYFSYLCIKEKKSIGFPSLFLALAMGFHLEAGFLGFCLVYLCFIKVKEKEYFSVFLSCFTFLIIFGSILFFFHVKGWPIRSLYYDTHAMGHGGNIRRMLVNPSVKYYFQVFNLLCLLFPAFFMLCVLFFKRSIRFDEFNVFLIIGSVSTLIFMMGWKASLGVYNDWNLFAITALPLSILFWRNVVKITHERTQKAIQIFIILFSLHSYSWILGNHFL